MSPSYDYYRHSVIRALQVAVAAQLIAFREGRAGGLVKDGKALSGYIVLYSPLALHSLQIRAHFNPYLSTLAVRALAVDYLDALETGTACILNLKGRALDGLAGCGHVIFYVNFTQSTHI